MRTAGVSLMLMRWGKSGGLMIMASVIVVIGRMLRRMIMSTVVMFGVIVGRGFVCRVAHRGVPKVLVAK